VDTTTCWTPDSVDRAPEVTLTAARSTGSFDLTQR
jgi:hypothetical protein